MKSINILLFLISHVTLGQINGEKLIHGKVIADSASVEGINILNLVTEKTTVTNKNGEFTISAKADDLLILTAVNLEIKRKLIEVEDLKTEVIIIQMIPKMTELMEVIVNEYPGINAVALGIVPKGQKTYTPAERGRYSPPKGIYDALKIMITGKDPAKEKAIATEKKIKALRRLENIFDNKYYVKTLKIPKEYIKGFQFFCVEDKAILDALISKDIVKTKLLVDGLAENYNQLIACEYE